MSKGIDKSEYRGAGNHGVRLDRHCNGTYIFLDNHLKGELLSSFFGVFPNRSARIQSAELRM
jgi:hypothetical protein